MSSPRQSAVLVAITCFLSLSLGACNRPKATVGPVAVRTKVLANEPIDDLMRFSASVEPRQKIDLSFRVAGTVEHVYTVTVVENGRKVQRDAQVGDVIPRGAILAQLERRDYERDVQLKRSRLESAVAQRAYAEREADRLTAAFDKGAASLAEKDDAVTRREMAIAFAHAADVEVRVAEDRLADTALAVPIENATIVVKKVEPNERIRENQAVFQIMDRSEVHAVFGVPDAMVSRVFPPTAATAPSSAPTAAVAVGQPIEVYVEALSRRLVGRVSKIAPAADPKTRTFLTEVTVANAEGDVKPGMIATIKVGTKLPPVMLVPLTAIQAGTTADEFAVFCVVHNDDAGTTVERRRVSLGGVYNNQVQLKSESAVSPGDEIVITNAWRLTPGAQVRVDREEDLSSGPLLRPEAGR